MPMTQRDFEDDPLKGNFEARHGEPCTEKRWGTQLPKGFPNTSLTTTVLCSDGGYLVSLGQARLFEQRNLHTDVQQN